MHHVYPPIYNNVHTAIHDKLAQLKIAKLEGIDFNVKGTIECSKSADEIIDFYGDRKIVITKRKNVTELIASTLFAIKIKAFHLRKNNYAAYTKSLQTTVTMDDDMMQLGYEILEIVTALWDMEAKIKERNIPYIVTYYEDLHTEEAIFTQLSQILETDEWIKYLAPNYKQMLPVKVDKEYHNLITNYTDIEEMVDNAALL